MPSRQNARTVLGDLPFGTIFINYTNIRPFMENEPLGAFIRVDAPRAEYGNYILVFGLTDRGILDHGSAPILQVTPRSTVEDGIFRDYDFYNLRHMSPHWKHSIIRYGWDGELNLDF